jgi:hypothetical protein
MLAQLPLLFPRVALSSVVPMAALAPSPLDGHLRGRGPVLAASDVAPPPEPDVCSLRGTAAPILAELRARFHVSKLVASGLPTGLPAFEDWLGSWPRPGLTEVTGAPGAGRLAPLLPALRNLQTRGERILLVDAAGNVQVRALPGLENVLVVRAGLARAAWVAEQAARSGALAAVVLVDAPPLGARVGVRLGRAAEAGHCTVFVVGERTEPAVGFACRVRVEGWGPPTAEGVDVLRVHCGHHRRGRGGERRAVVLDACEGVQARWVAA